MRYRHKTTGVLCKFVRITAHGWLCVDVNDRGHYLCYPETEWEAA